MGLMFDPDTDRRRVVHALIFSPACRAIASCGSPSPRRWRSFEAAWEFFGGIFALVIPDNMAAIQRVLAIPSIRFEKPVIRSSVLLR